MNLVPAESPNLAVMPTERIVEYFIKNQESEGTKSTYSSTLRGFFAWANKSYKDVGPFDALDYSEYLKTTCAAATTQTRIATLKTFFRFAKNAGLITINPFELVKQKKSSNKVGKKFLLPKETDALLTELKKKGEKHYILGLILAATGMRISEAQQLSWCDFILMPDDSASIRATRKGDEEQLLSLRDDVWEAIKAYMKREPNQFDHSHLFSNPSGNRASVVTLRAWVKEASKKAKITKNVTPHTLRHSFVTNSLNAGADLRDVQVYVNHKSITTTQLYMHGKNQKVGDFLSIKVRTD